MVRLVISSKDGIQPVIYNDILQVIRHVVQNMPIAEKTSFVNDTVNTVINETTVMASIITQQTANEEQKRYQYQMLSMLSTCLCSMNKMEEEMNKIPNIQQIFQQLCQIALINDTGGDRTTLNIIEVASQAAGSIVNKMPKGAVLEQLLLENLNIDSSSSGGGNSLLQDIVPGSSKFVQQARLWSWVAKGLIMKRHSFGTTMCIDFCTVVINSEYNDEEKAAAVRCISVVMSDSPICLNKECDIYLSSFFKHSLFRRVVPMLLEKISLKRDEAVLDDAQTTVTNHFSNPNDRYHLLHLIMVMITYSPTTVVQSELNNLLHVVILSLTSKSSMLLQETSLPAVAMVLHNDIQAFTPHAESCCRSLLSLCTVDSSVSTCISSLKCLSLMRGLPMDVALRIRDDVLSGLWTTLDHPSRKVRQACVVCRNQWFVAK